MTVVPTQLVSPNNREVRGVLGREASRFKNASERSSSWPGEGTYHSMVYSMWRSRNWNTPHSYEKRVAQGKHVVHWFLHLMATPLPNQTNSSQQSFLRPESRWRGKGCQEDDKRSQQLSTKIYSRCRLIAHSLPAAKSHIWYGNKLRVMTHAKSTALIRFVVLEYVHSPLRENFRLQRNLLGRWAKCGPVSKQTRETSFTIYIVVTIQTWTIHTLKNQTLFPGISIDISTKWTWQYPYHWEKHLCK